MKAFLLLAFLFAAPAFAETKEATLSDLHSLAVLEQAVYRDGTCSVTVKEIKGGISISVEDETNRAELLVSTSDLIQLTSQVDAEGNLRRRFEIKDVGVFYSVHADDSYAALEVTSGGRTVKCETDF